MLVTAEIDVEPEEPRDLIRRRIRDRYLAAEDNRRSSGIDCATLSRCLGFRAVQGHRCVRQSIAARELGEATHVAIGLLAYEVEAAAAILELPAASGRKHGDDNVRHLGDLRHERKEGLARYFDYSRIDYRAQRQGGGTAVQQADLPHKLSWPNGRRIMALASERINYFNLALLHVHEAVRLFARLGHDRALGIRHYLPRRPQCLNMRGRKWCPYHLAQIFAYRLHQAHSAVGMPAELVIGKGEAPLISPVIGLALTRRTGAKSLARPRDALDSLENVLDVPYSGPRIHHDQPQHPASVEYGRTDIAVAALIQFFLDLPVDPVGVFADLIAKPKAQDVRMGLVHGLKNP